MNKIEVIRKEEKKYHDYCYEHYKLFEEGSWLHKPVKTVMELIPLFEEIENSKVLDLGSGVGRNSIPVAEAIKHKNGIVVCVDLLDSAIEKLITYSREYNVERIIQTVKADIGNYEIKQNEFDFIIAVSSLEHVASEKVFEKVVKQMVAGTKQNGINCIIVNSEVEEVAYETNEKLEPMMELNITTEKMIDKLKKFYYGWEILETTVKPLEFQIKREDKSILLKTNAVTFVVKKSI